MKILELFEQTIGTTGSTTGQASTVQPVSNRPSDRPSTATSAQTGQQPSAQNKQLDILLKQNQINVKSTDDFLRAFDAVRQNKPIDTLPPEQQKALSDYTKATLSKPGLPNQMNLIMKTAVQSKPNQPPTSQNTQVK